MVKFLRIDKINIPELRLIVRDNLIGFENIGMHDYSDNFKVDSSQLRESFEYVISKYPYLEDIFLIIVNTVINNNFNPCGIVLMSSYYLKNIEEKGINTLNLISEFRKHKRDSDYLLSSLSVLKVGYYLMKKNIIFEFPQKKEGHPNPDIIAWKDDDKFKIDVKGRGAAQLKRLAYEFASLIENPNQPNEWHSFEKGIQDELEKSKLRKIVKDAFLEQEVDMLIVDETNNLFQIGGMFMIREMYGNIEQEDTFSFTENNLIFCSFFNGNFKCFEINKDVFLRDTLLDNIKDRVPNSCDNCGENNIDYWKEDKEEVTFKCQKCGVIYPILFEQIN